MICECKETSDKFNVFCEKCMTKGVDIKHSEIEKLKYENEAYAFTMNKFATYIARVGLAVGSENYEASKIVSAVENAMMEFKMLQSEVERLTKLYEGLGEDYEKQYELLGNLSNGSSVKVMRDLQSQNTDLSTKLEIALRGLRDIDRGKEPIGNIVERTLQKIKGAKADD